MEKKEPDEECSEETVRLEKENAHLRREIAIEERVTKRWQALAGIFHDTLVSALRRYDPVYYEKLQNRTEERRVQAAAEAAVPDEKKTRTKPQKTDTPALLREENARLSKVLDAQTKRHRKWEQTAVRFHDTLWQVLLKYEPDTYGAICPAQAKEGDPDFTELPEFAGNAEPDTHENL